MIVEDEDLWALHPKSCALDNFVLVAGIDRSGTEGNRHFIEQSMIIGPHGHVIDQLDEKEDMLITTINLDEVAQDRR